MNFVTVQGRRIEVARLSSARPRQGYPTIVFLHEGLGSVAMWRDFPQQVADAVGCDAVVYSRYGYGNSDPLVQPRDVRFMHDEGLNALPELLDKLSIERPILFGHSDGASIALIHAGGAKRPLAGVIVMAPHVLIEDVCIDSIKAIKGVYDDPKTRLRERLARFHADVDSAFRGWNDIWLDPELPSWNIEAYLPAIDCPILAIQGEDDAYGTMDQIDRIARQAGDVRLLKLADCGHSPHKDKPAEVLDAVTAFVERIVKT
ncbi:MAG: alpha/beta hydrolase [Desulfococcus multivorans]|jgi:pimeloyl-ACP methyl ester carboxylesterase|nr:alpha/beta hydrolase [Desulfococcus multivorans]